MERHHGVQVDVEFLRRTRSQLALTQQALAERADRSILTIHKAERGDSVNLSTLSRLRPLSECRLSDF